jgi:hypothetical protein
MYFCIYYQKFVLVLVIGVMHGMITIILKNVEDEGIIDSS